MTTALAPSDDPITAEIYPLLEPVRSALHATAQTYTRRSPEWMALVGAAGDITVAILRLNAALTASRAVLAITPNAITPHV